MSMKYSGPDSKVATRRGCLLKTKTESEHARERIGNEVTSGAEVGYQDGTITDGDKVVKAGPLAIVENGKLIGFRKAEESK
jgi:translation initiation factor 6 (eIF-6)